MAASVEARPAAETGVALARRTRLRWLRVGTVLCTVFLFLLGFVTLYPVFSLVLNSFVISGSGATQAYGFDNWRAAVTEPGLYSALLNTILVTVVVQAISMPLAIVIAWAIARTDIVGGSTAEFLFWISYFLPSLVLTSGWILVADPGYGVLNQALRQWLPGPLVNIYSFWGIVFIHVTGIGLGAKVMLLVPAFRNMDASLEEASRMSGAGSLRTLVRIIIPAVAPAILIVLLASLIRSLEAFEVEYVLGSPIRFQVYSTKVYGLINQSPVNYGAATALSMFALGALLPLVWLQLWVSGRRSYATVSGRMVTARTRLRRLRWPVTLLVFGVASLGTILPIGFMLMGSFMNLFGYFNVEQIWTLRHWMVVLSEPKFGRSVGNTLLLGVSTAVLALIVYSLMAYVAVRTRYRARWAFDALSWVPFTVPGIVLGLGYLLFVLNTPFLRPLYGTMWLLVLVSTLAVMTISMQLFKGTMLQLSEELEEASRMAGASWLYTFRRVVIPLLMPAVVTAAVMTFAAAARQVSVIVPLTRGETEPLAVLQLGYLLAENRSAATVVGTVTVAITVGMAFLARALGVRASRAA